MAKPYRILTSRRTTVLAGTMILAAAAGFSGCADDEPDPAGPGGGAAGGAGASGGAGGAGTGGGGAGPVYVLERPSKSSTIAISDDDAVVALVNQADGSMSLFTTEDNSRTAKVDTGGEPSAVVIHPDAVTAFVANRRDGTVVKVSAIDTGSPTVSEPVDVGSEPTGLALSPTGARLFVAEWAESRVSVIDTATMEVLGSVAVRNPRAVAVTNDGDEDDDDELLVVPEFFGEVSGDGEVSDTGRIGRVRVFSLGDVEAAPDTITFNPIDSTFGTPSTMTSPNQLYAVAVAGDRILVPSVSASPEPPVSFNTNVQPVVYVGSLSDMAEDESVVGSSNLAAHVRDEVTDGPRHFLADIVDIAMVGTDIAYVLSRGANVVQRVEYNEATGISIGSAFNEQIDVGAAPAGAPEGCLGPNGIVTSHDGERAFVNCWVNRRLGVVDLTTQAQVTTVEASPPPATPEAIAKSRGLKFFFTGRARWSSESWSACSSCHPDGLTDNITWAFAAGPRQTVSLDGSFSRGSGPQVQRIFNWTAIFDEIHDFERNTRGVSGGLGAVTHSTSCGDLSQETRSDIAGPPDGLLGEPVKEVQDNEPDNCTTDWNDIEAWIKGSVRPPRALRSSDAAAVANGAAIFESGGCDKCHSGAGWTVSRLYWTPSTANNSDLTTTGFPENALPTGFPASWNEHTFEIALEPGTSIAPLQVACAIRNTNTFGIPGDAEATAAIEVKPNDSQAQGEKGFNIPALYGLAVGAPYLHHGQAATLNDLFTNPAWNDHLRAGNPVFVPTEAEVDDLIAFLLSIDADAPEMTTPAGFDVCRATFP
jgi:YVTN family beta-propeller protein